jgi:hypothetical protein
LYRPIIHFGLVSYFTTTPPASAAPTDYTVLKFSDEFNVDGAPDATKWVMILVLVLMDGVTMSLRVIQMRLIMYCSGGNLKITAKVTSYTSARLKSENKYEFTYGKRLEQS